MRCAPALRAAAHAAVNNDVYACFAATLRSEARAVAAAARAAATVYMSFLRPAMNWLWEALASCAMRILHTGTPVGEMLLSSGLECLCCTGSVHAHEAVFVHVGVHTVLLKPTVHRTRLCCSSDVPRQPLLKLDNLAVWQVREPAARASAGGVILAAAVAAVTKLPAIARCARLRKVTSATGAATAAAAAMAVAAGEMALVFDEACVRHGAPLPPDVRLRIITSANGADAGAAAMAVAVHRRGGVGV